MLWEGVGAMSDLRTAFRSLASHPGLSVLVVVTLALGIGANTAIFSAVNSLILHDPPFANPDRLVRITTVRGDEGGGPLAVPELDDIRALPVVADAALYTDQGMYNASGFGTPEELQATITTHDLFRVLGVEPLVGSTFPASFDRSRNFGLVISHGLWTRKYGRDPSILGRTMTLDGAPGYTIFGVMPASFAFPSHSDLYRSSGIAADPKYYERRDARDRFVLARLRPNVTVTQAQSAIDELARRLEQEFPATNTGVGFRVTALSDVYTANLRPYLVLLFAAVTLVLVVACANVANLLLSRAIARDREIAIRAALGAGRTRLLRQLLAESLLLSLIGAGLGGVLAMGGIRLLRSMMPVQLPPWMQIVIDGRVGVFLALVAIATGLLAGIVPAWRSTSAQLSSVLKEGARGSSDGVQQHRLRNALVIVEVAFALVLLVGASLLLQSVWRLHRVDLGLTTDRALTFRVELGWAAYGTLEKTRAFHEQVLERLRALSGVQAVTFDHNLPMSGKPRDPLAVRTPGQSRDEEAQNPYVHLHQVGPDYFTTMGIGVLRGRSFDTRDRADSVPAVVVSTRLAERLWPGRDPIGQRLQLQNTATFDQWLAVVGVVTPTLHHELDGAPGFDIYRPFTQSSTAGPYYVIRTAGDPMTIARPATGIVGQVDANQSFLDVHTYDQRIANRIWQQRVAGTLFGSFAVLALVLATVGLYGVLSYVVSQQTREIGVRVALGAAPRNVMGWVLARGLALAVIGALVGLALAFPLAQVVSGMLYGVSPHDPLTFTVAPLLLIAVAALASYVPVRRALRVDPIVALRAG